MGYDLYSTVQTPNPSDPETEPWSYLDNERKLLNYQRFNESAWKMLITLAHSYGWQPQGTQPGEDQEDETNDADNKKIEWNLDYCRQNGRLVTADDALGIAEALESALDDIPDRSTQPKAIYLETEDDVKEYSKAFPNSWIGSIFSDGFYLPGLNIHVPNVYLSAWDYFGGKEKKLVINFINFCKKGAFTIR